MVAAAAAAYVVLGAPPLSDFASLFRAEAPIAPGFVGMAKFGEWRLICVPGPPSLDALSAPAASGAAGAAPRQGPQRNSCRINQETPAQPQGGGNGEAPAQVIVAANFSLVGPKHMPAAMLRLPITARPGDAISLKFEDGSIVKTTVRDCQANECVAAGNLTPGDWAHLAAAKSLKLTFPAAGRQWVVLDLPVDGLSTAIAALARAESGPEA